MSVALSEHLPLLATAPDGIQKLRGLILELAVRGKLVPQDPNDEPASELLKRIAKERARLEAEGKIKKLKVLQAPEEDERPFEVPPSWAWTRLGEITNFGQTDKDGEIRDTTWVLDLEDIQKDTSVLLRKVRFAERQAKSDKNRFQEGDVLYGKLRPYLNKVIVADEEGVCTTEILPVRGYYGVFPRYLMHAVKRPDFLAYVNSKSYGMKMPRLGTDDGRLSLFPLPPEREQHRIVAKVDELMALCDRLEAEQSDAASAHERLVATLLGTLTQSTDAADLAANWERLAEHFDTLFTTEATLDALKQTILQLAVMGKLVPQDPNDEPASELLKRIAKERARLEAGGAIKKSRPLPPVIEDELSFSVPLGWERTRLGVVIELISGQHLTPDEYTDGLGELIPYLTGPAEFGETAPNPTRSTKQTRAIAITGDILLTVKGSGVGKVNRVTQSKLAISRQLMAVRTITVCSDFAELVIRSAEQHFQERTVGIAIPGIGRDDVQGLALGLPPLAEQHRIVARVDELMALVDHLKAGLAESRAQQERLASTLIETALKAA